MGIWSNERWALLDDVRPHLAAQHACRRGAALGVVHELVLGDALVTNPGLIAPQYGEVIRAARLEGLPSLRVVDAGVRCRVTAGHCCYVHLGLACQAQVVARRQYECRAMRRFSWAAAGTSHGACCWRGGQVGMGRPAASGCGASPGPPRRLAILIPFLRSPEAIWGRTIPAKVRSRDSLPMIAECGSIGGRHLSRTVAARAHARSSAACESP